MKTPTITKQEVVSALERALQASEIPLSPPPGSFSVKEYQEHVGLEESAARRRLDKLILSGVLVKTKVVANGKVAFYYNNPPEAKAANKAKG